MFISLFKDGVLNVTAAEKSTGSKNKITITNDENRLTKKEIEQMIADAERYRLDDAEQRKRSLARNDLEDYCHDVKKLVDGNPNNHSSAMILLKTMCDQTIKWLSVGPLASVEEIVAKKEKIGRLRHSVVLPDVE